MERPYSGNHCTNNRGHRCRSNNRGYNHYTKKEKEVPKDYGLASIVPINQLCRYSKNLELCPFDDHCNRFHSIDDVITIA